MHVNIATRAALLLAALIGISTMTSSCAKAAADGGTPNFDSVYFGNNASETAHSVVAIASDTIAGGLGQPARRLLPLTPVSYKGGTLTFTLKVDPAGANYVTFKFWGSDKGEAAGRILLFSGDKQIGYRDQGDYDVVNQIEDLPIYPGRFVYTTLPLPPSLTNGKTSLSLTLEPIGWIFQYGGSFAHRQKPFNVASRGIYAAYMSTSPYFELPKAEQQGEPPVVSARPSPGPEFLDKVRAHVNDYVKKSALHPAKIDQSLPHGYGGTVILLATAYQTPWSSIYHDPKALETIAIDGDGYADLQSVDAKFVGSDWPGAGPLGWALLRVYPALQGAGLLDQQMTLPGGKVVPRRQAWADTLKASVDFWQAHRRSYTNQSMIVDTNIYTANEGLRLLDPSRALPKETVLNYLYQSIGLAPWTGSVTSERSGGGADLPAGAYSERPYGNTYYDMTAKGLGRELGYVAGYGETVLHFVSDMVRLTDDPKIREQLAKIAVARSYYRYPLPDEDGYKAMVLEAITDNRNGHYPADVAYAAHHGSRESEPMEAAALTKDPAVAGMARQELADNQYFTYLDSHMKTGDPNQVYGLLTAVDDYPIVAALPQTGYKLPMTDGQPDFVWSDEDDAVVALKHGDRRLYFNFYYRAERAINGVVRIHDMTPQVERIVTAHSNYEYTPSGHEYVRDDWTDIIRGVGNPPPGERLHQAWAGEKMPIQKRPDDAAVPTYGDWGPFLGRADFYSLVYGDYVIGLNTNAAKSYRLAVPKGAKSAVDLATGKNVPIGGSITVSPKSTVVLYVGK
ncbi:MAG: hypothetical protein P4L33_07880 [Capsulimonadaceae bacterium]|nr:hypothetical protein [Capsulimonadaceae bacterium]